MDTRLLWLALGGFAGAVEGALIGSLLPQVSIDMGVTVGQAGYLVFGYAIIYGIGTPVLSTVFGGAERRKLLASAELVFAFCALVIALAPQFGWLIVARIVLALGAGLYTATALATAVAMSAPERRGSAIGIVMAGQSFAVLAGVPLGAFIAATFGWRTVYAIVAVLGFAASASLALWLPRGLSGDKRSLRERIGVLKIPGVPLALLATLLVMIPVYMPLIYVAPLALHSAGLDKTMLPLVLLANGLGSFAGSNLGGRFADRVGPRRAMIVMFVAELFVLLAFEAIPYLPGEMRLASFLFAMAGTGVVGWGAWAALSSRLAGLAPKSVPLAIALNLTALNVGVALTATIGGAVIDSAGVGSIILVAVPFAIAAIVVATINRRDAKVP